MGENIIIDGVDVSECTYYSHNGYKNVSCMNAHNGMMKCENFPCYYKQFQRVKAELEQYKKSKQASYEVMQVEWNKARNELKDIKTNNELLLNINSKLKVELFIAETSLKEQIEENEKLKQENHAIRRALKDENIINMIEKIKGEIK